jgi:hypothetical protein
MVTVPKEPNADIPENVKPTRKQWREYILKLMMKTQTRSKSTRKYFHGSWTLTDMGDEYMSIEGNGRLVQFTPMAKKAFLAARDHFKGSMQAFISYYIGQLPAPVVIMPEDPTFKGLEALIASCVDTYTDEFPSSRLTIYPLPADHPYGLRLLVSVKIRIVEGPARSGFFLDCTVDNYCAALKVLQRRVQEMRNSAKTETEAAQDH